ncbi:DUF1617 family protein [Candidatus Enterococcus clewellii]|uniref:DUF1617 family protein n=1 Tax=Candidatus Enterococcus clewellii TaxID=1834193 RepID=A0A242K373_9ENTE|nr:DUF1617 family protein [Enterococcus sp. 9E7_DIV0242]OTP13446.1 hypothetical protein A5888_002924 [Enterococcus sp. 9E7_DIV0242]
MNFKNEEIIPAINFLQKIELKAKASRARSKIIILLSKKLEELQNDERTLLEHYSEKNESGQPIMIDSNTFSLSEENSLEVARERIDLLNETVTIVTTEYQEHVQRLQEALENYDSELSGSDAEMYDRLLDELEREGAKL